LQTLKQGAEWCDGDVDLGIGVARPPLFEAPDLLDMRVSKHRMSLIPKTFGPKKHHATHVGVLDVVFGGDQELMVLAIDPHRKGEGGRFEPLA
jgi:hypothetical protein